MSRGRVLVAMSGGVDSSVAALLLLRQGYTVIGATMAIWPEGSEEEARQREGCCSLGAVEDARAVARHLGIDHYTLNLREEFSRTVIAEFEASYLAGRTPNPCITCNRTVKFDALLAKADELGAEYLATGHYGRLEVGEDGWPVLRQAVDRRKDQSYVLYPVAVEALRRTLLPLGEWPKEAVRRLAREEGLPVWDKPDSVELCFVASDYRRTLAQRRPEAWAPGEVVDLEGRPLGVHPGVAFFTVGQRRGLALGTQGPAEAPRYVVALRPEQRQVVVGPRQAAEHRALAVDRPHWLLPPPAPGDSLAVTVRVRAHGPLAPARLTCREDGGVDVELAQPLFGVAPGQAAVWYREERVLGGGPIDRAWPAAGALQEAATAAVTP